jgi:hypothetical protein
MKRLLLPILALVFATSGYAQDDEKVATETRISKQSTTESGDRGLFTIPSVETLNKGQYSFGYAWSNFDRSPHNIDINNLPLSVSYGLVGRFTLTGTFETERHVTARTLAQSGYNNSFPFVNHNFVKGYGDTYISGKYRLQRRKDNIGGLSLRGFAKFGTADANRGLGTGATDAGADVILTSVLPLNFVMDTAFGFTATSNAKDASGITLVIKDEMRSALGTAWPASGLNILKGRLQGIFEYSTVTYVGAGSNNSAKNIQNPSDMAAGLRFLLLDSGVTLHAGIRKNTKLDTAFPGDKNLTGFTFSLSYTKPVRPPGRNQFPIVSLETSADQIRAGGSATITATGYDADKDVLTYSWSASGGQVVGSGDKVTFTAPAAAGKYTVRVMASDGKGGTATSSVDVNVTP